MIFSETGHMAVAWSVVKNFGCCWLHRYLFGGKMELIGQLQG
jgi:hypothetical protein